MSKVPLVSVIITAWNRADVVGRAIDSVLKQSFQDFEIVLVDDASTDDLAAVVTANNWPRLHFVRNSVNRGIAGAKNAGIENSRGRYIAFLDSDDEWLPDKLTAQLAAFEDNPNGPPLSFTAYHIKRENGRCVARIPRRSSGSWFEAAIRGEMFSLGSTLLAERRCFEQVGLLDETIRRMEDRDWILRYFDHWQDLAIVEQPMAMIHNSGWPRSDIVRQSMGEIYRLNRERVARHGARFDRMLRSGMQFEIATAEFRNGEYGRAIARLAGAVVLDPSNFGVIHRRLARKIADRDYA